MTALYHPTVPVDADDIPGLGTDHSIFPISMAVKIHVYYEGTITFFNIRAEQHYSEHVLESSSTKQPVPLLFNEVHMKT